MAHCAKGGRLVFLGLLAAFAFGAQAKDLGEAARRGLAKMPPSDPEASRPAPLPERSLPAGASLEVHEWGVVQHDMATGRVSGLEDDLPAWILRPAPVPPVRPGMELQRKPLIYLYPSGVEKASVRVRCLGGSLLCWWPQAEIARDGADGVLTWPEIHFPGEGKAAFREVRAGHWIAKARDVDAARLEAGEASERFLFYEGARRIFQPLALGGMPDAVRIRNAGAEPVHGLMLVRREGAKLFLASLPTLAADAEAVLRPIAAGEDAEGKALSDLKVSLEKAGLFAKEAAGLAEIWREDFLRNEGLTLLYRWDEAVYDRLLPLEVSPPPSRRVRVMVAALAGIDLPFAERVSSLASRLGAADYEAREKAARDLAALGTKAAPYLAPALLSGDLEVRAGAEGVLAGGIKQAPGR